jgi:hypothetical protein
MAMAMSYHQSIPRDGMCIHAERIRPAGLRRPPALGRRAQAS